MQLRTWAGAAIPGVGPGFARRDPFGSEIHWHQCGRRGRVYGWERAPGAGGVALPLQCSNKVAGSRPSEAAPA